jgi:hypothetical protein
MVTPSFPGPAASQNRAPASQARATAPSQAGAIACAGHVEPIDGLSVTTDPSLVNQASGGPGRGALCTGEAFVATKPVTVYRVWDKSKGYTQLGRWWSFDKPAGPRDAYRGANAICPEWSPLDVVSECRLKPGSHVVVGPGQSVQCQSTSYPASPTNQVYVPNDARDPESKALYVEGCTPGSPWP